MHPVLSRYMQPPITTVTKHALNVQTYSQRQFLLCKMNKENNHQTITSKIIQT
mgnify:CR=1 FL=1